MVEKHRDGGKRAACLEETVFVELLRTTEALSRPLAQLMKSEDLSSTQYNVLRILRGAGEGIPCSEIGERMITRDPDITRLLDRLEKRGLVERTRDAEDRRVVLTRITRDGLDTLARLDEPVRQTHRDQLSFLGRERLETLAQILRACREPI